MNRCMSIRPPINKQTGFICWCQLDVQKSILEVSIPFFKWVCGSNTVLGILVLISHGRTCVARSLASPSLF